MYMAISKLGACFTEPPGYPNLSGYRIIDMFTRVLTIPKKEEVMASFSVIGGTLRVIIATTAFGMGVDIPEIIDWGLPATLEEYVQEAGRSGRDGRHSIAYEGNRAKNSSSLVKEYEANCLLCKQEACLTT